MFTNLQTDVPTISSDTGGTTFGFVGDGVQFGIDSNRPAGVITDVFIDANIAGYSGEGPLGAGAKKSQIFNPGWKVAITGWYGDPRTLSQSRTSMTSLS